MGILRPDHLEIQHRHENGFLATPAVANLGNPNTGAMHIVTFGGSTRLENVAATVLGKCNLSKDSDQETMERVCERTVLWASILLNKVDEFHRRGLDDGSQDRIKDRTPDGNGSSSGDSPLE